MSEETEPKQKARRGGCTYRTMHALLITATGEWIPAGVVADLSDCTDESLRVLLQRGLIETADPSKEDPLFNPPTGKARAVARPPCPCGK